jgi:hypothetical protein
MTHPDILYKNNWGDAWDPELSTAAALAKTQFALELRVPRAQAEDQTHLPEHCGRSLWVIREDWFDVSAIFERGLEEDGSVVVSRRADYTPLAVDTSQLVRGQGLCPASAAVVT